MHDVPDEPRIVRSGVANLFRFMGIGLIVVGVPVGVGCAIIGVVIGDLSMLWMLILTLVFGVAGTLMHLAGRRSRVLIERHGLRWTSPLARERSIAWRDVHHVEVPQSPWQGRTVILHLNNGVRQPIAAIGMSSSDSGAWADAGYQAAGAEVIAAHQRWIANLR